MADEALGRLAWLEGGAATPEAVVVVGGDGGDASDGGGGGSGGGGGYYASPTAAVLARVVMASCAQLRRSGHKAAAATRLRRLVASSALPCVGRAAAFVQLLRDLTSDRAKLAALRLCEAANACDGRLEGAVLSALDDAPRGPGAAAKAAAAGARDDAFELSRAQLVHVRRTLKRLAKPPHRWKRPNLPELLSAREVWLPRLG